MKQLLTPLFLLFSLTLFAQTTVVTGPKKKQQITAPAKPKPATPAAKPQQKQQTTTAKPQPKPTQKPQQPVAQNHIIQIYGHDCVDLGLPSGTKWATCNIGASRPEQNGNYYAWGETATKSDYSTSACTTFGKSLAELSSSSIIDSSNNLTRSNDVAAMIWGGSWRIPTLGQMKELLNTSYCSWILTTQKGVKGYKVTSKKNGNYIFLPAAGYRGGTSYINTYGHYWTSTIGGTSLIGANSLLIYPGGCDTVYDDRHLGYSIRPVSK